MICQSNDILILCFNIKSDEIDGETVIISNEFFHPRNLISTKLEDTFFLFLCRSRMNKILTELLESQALRDVNDVNWIKRISHKTKSDYMRLPAFHYYFPFNQMQLHQFFASLWLSASIFFSRPSKQNSETTQLNEADFPFHSASSTWFALTFGFLYEFSVICAQKRQKFWCLNAFFSSLFVLFGTEWTRTSVRDNERAREERKNRWCDMPCIWLPCFCAQWTNDRIWIRMRNALHTPTAIPTSHTHSLTINLVALTLPWKLELNDE